MIYQGESVQCSWIEAGIAELRFEATKGAVNILNRTTLDEYRKAVDALKSTDQLKGVMVTSGKSTFIVGADITEFLAMFAAPPEQLQKWLEQANSIFNDFEDLPVPTLAVINGTAFGGGMEVCLACDLRLASTKAVIGLPETKLGLIPGFGGTTRLPRIIGSDNALEMIAGASVLKAPAALKNGSIDAITAPEKLIESAIKMIKAAINGELDWEQRRATKKGPLKLCPTDAAMAFSTAKAFIFGKAGKNYPAPIEAVNVVERASMMSRDEALQVEAKGFMKVALTPVAESLISLFLNDQVLKKLAKNASRIASKVEHAAVLGAGIMGGGIAYQAASSGYSMVMKDINNPALDLGMGEASKLLSKQVARGKLDTLKMAAVLGKIKPTLHYEEVKAASLVVEAVIENPKIKDSVLVETEALLDENAILCSNTSTISIDLLAKNLKRPANFCGMHFFNPVHRMPLVEVIRGSQTSDETIATVVAFASSMGKSPIVVKDCPGFLVNRVLFPYFGGFSQLLRDGADFRTIDKVMEGFGWPMGPAYLLDVVGLDTGYHANAVMAAGFPDRMSSDYRTAIDVMYEAKRFGQKTNTGFYRYEMDKKGRPKKLPDPETFNLLSTVCADNVEFDKQEIIERMMLPLIIETIRCVEEGIVGTVAEADMGLIYGIGFPPFRGGALKYADSIGIENLVKMANKYQHLGKAYEPTEGMKVMAEKGQSFYSHGSGRADNSSQEKK